MIINKNNKSIVTLSSDGYIEKKYITNDAEERVIQDQNTLLYLMDRFGSIHYNDWKIRVVRLKWIAIDKKSIGLEYVKGTPLAKLKPENLLHAEFLYGIWLGNYKNTILSNPGKGLLYTDLSLHNALYDIMNKEFVVIDPGKHYGRSGYIYEDIIQHVYSISAHCMRNFLNPFKYIEKFIDGYLTQDRGRIEFKIYYYSIIRDSVARICIIKKNYKSLLKYITGLFILFPMYAIYTPFILYLKNKGVGR